MIVSHMWLVEHLNDPNVVILDSKDNVSSFADCAGRRLTLR